MATLRPAVATDDGYIQKIIKYIPTEIIAAYTALTGYLEYSSNTPPDHYTAYYKIVLCVLILVTPVWTYYAVLDNTTTDKPSKEKKALVHSCIAMVAFIIWVYALGNPLLKVIICDWKYPKDPDCGGYYSPVLGKVFLVLFIILTPLISRIALGEKFKLN